MLDLFFGDCFYCFRHESHLSVTEKVLWLTLLVWPTSRSSRRKYLFTSSYHIHLLWTKHIKRGRPYKAPWRRNQRLCYFSRLYRRRSGAKLALFCQCWIIIISNIHHRQHMNSFRRRVLFHQHLLHLLHNPPPNYPTLSKMLRNELPQLLLSLCNKLVLVHAAEWISTHRSVTKPTRCWNHQQNSCRISFPPAV